MRLRILQGQAAGAVSGAIILGQSLAVLRPKTMQDSPHDLLSLRVRELRPRSAGQMKIKYYVTGKNRSLRPAIAAADEHNL